MRVILVRDVPLLGPCLLLWSQLFCSLQLLQKPERTIVVTKVAELDELSAQDAEFANCRVADITITLTETPSTPM